MITPSISLLAIEQAPELIDKKTYKKMFSQQVLNDSELYSNSLGLGSRDLDHIESFMQERFSQMPDIEECSKKGFLKITIEGKEFTLFAHHTHLAHCGWTYIVSAVCINDSSLNLRTGRGSTLVNIVPEFWKEAIANGLRSCRKDLQEHLKKSKLINEAVWTILEERSEELCNALNLSERDFNVIENHLQRNNEGSFLFVTIDKIRLALTVQNTCGAPYGRSWKRFTHVICLSDPSLNFSIGRGTTALNILRSKELHQSLLDKIREHNIQDSLSELIDSTRERVVSIWQATCRFSDALCKEFNLGKRDLEWIQENLQTRTGSMYLLETARHGFLSVTLNNKIFNLFVTHTCGAPYGGKWRYLIQAACMNDGSLNNTAGGGTTLINAISNHWLETLLLKAKVPQLKAAYPSEIQATNIPVNL